MCPGGFGRPGAYSAAWHCPSEVPRPKPTVVFPASVSWSRSACGETRTRLVQCLAPEKALELLSPQPQRLQTQVPRDDHSLHLVRALADLEDLLVAVQARDRRLLHVPVAAVDLERGADHAV